MQREGPHFNFPYNIQSPPQTIFHAYEKGGTTYFEPLAVSPQYYNTIPLPILSNPLPIQSDTRHNVYIRGLPSSMNDATLLQICSRIGDTISVKAVVDLHTEKCKGFGFALFRDKKDSDSAIAYLISLGYTACYARVKF